MNYCFPLLTADQIEVKVKQIGEKGAVALLYKTARTDMDILDEVVGPLNWQRKQDEVKGNLYCTISIWDDAKGVWVEKSDCGIESRSDGEGNEKKGEASDAFKRAGTNWGIGRELYTSPFIFLNVATAKDGQRYKLQNPFVRFDVREIGYDHNRRINRLVIVDNNGNCVFSFPKGNAKTETNCEKPAAQVTRHDPAEWAFAQAAYQFMTQHNMSQAAFVAGRKAAIAGGLVEDIPSNKMTKKDADKLFEAIAKNFTYEVQ